jgi:hypothetical protein
MYIQLDLEVRDRRPNKKRISSNIDYFQNKEFHSRKRPINKKLMFECYNLQDPLE